jgi:hypothetical protein
MPNLAHQDDVHRPRPKSARNSVSGFPLARKTNCPLLLRGMIMQRLNGMKDFSNVSFPPEVIQVMTLAMKSALSTLPHPVSSTHVQSVAETILRTAKDGERDPNVLERMALLELQISSRH